MQTVSMEVEPNNKQLTEEIMQHEVDVYIAQVVKEKEEEKKKGSGD